MLRASMIKKAWKGKEVIKGDQGGLAKNPPMVKSVFLSNSGIPISLELFEKDLPYFGVDECIYSIHFKRLLV